MIVVTGASRGLGQAITERLIETGEDVILFRAHSNSLWTSVRKSGWTSQSDWGPVLNTNIPNGKTLLNILTDIQTADVFLTE